MIVDSHYKVQLGQDTRVERWYYFTFVSRRGLLDCKIFVIENKNLMTNILGRVAPNNQDSSIVEKRGAQVVPRLETARFEYDTFPFVRQAACHISSHMLHLDAGKRFVVFSVIAAKHENLFRRANTSMLSSLFVKSAKFHP